MYELSRSVVSDCAASLTVARQTPLSMRLSRQDYWSRLPFPTPGDLLVLGLNQRLLHQLVDSLPLVPPGKPPKRTDTTIYKIINKDLVCSTGNSNQYSEITYMGKVIHMYMNN